MEKTKGRFAGTVRVGEKGQIVIPKGARELLIWFLVCWRV